MSLPMPTSINGTCLPPSVNEVSQESLPVEVPSAVLPPGYPLAAWKGEASSVSTSPACSTPRDPEQSFEEMNILVADLTLLQDCAIVDRNEGIDVLHMSLKQGLDEKQHGQFTRVEIPNDFFGLQSDEEDDGDEEEDEFRPKGSSNPPTKPKPSIVRSTASVGKPAGK